MLGGARGNLAQAQAALDKANAAAAKAWGGSAPGAASQAGAGKARGKGKLKDKNAAGVQICYAFNNGQPCKFTPCKFAHCCQVCEGDHPRTSPLCTGAGG